MTPVSVRHCVLTAHTAEDAHVNNLQHESDDTAQNKSSSPASLSDEETVSRHMMSVTLVERKRPKMTQYMFNLNLTDRPEKFHRLASSTVQQYLLYYLMYYSFDG